MYLFFLFCSILRTLELVGLCIQLRIIVSIIQMLTATSVDDKVSRSRIVPNGATNIFNLVKIISTMIMRPPDAMPNPGTEYTEIKEL